MNRREALALVGLARLISPTRVAPHALAQTSPRPAGVPFTSYGSGPALLAFNRAPGGYYDAFKKDYRVIVLDYPPQVPSQVFVDSFTPERVCADILSVADEAGAESFAWYGFSWGGVVGLQLAARTKRLRALVCGGWPPLGAEYKEMITEAAIRERTGDARMYNTYYRHLQDWPEREVVSKFECPRLTFAGSNDVFDAYGHTFRIGPTIAEKRSELEQSGWSVRMVDGFGHELGARSDVIAPLVRRFLDPILLRR